jgi:hypothetical protein
MFDVDERCIAVGVKVMAATALTAIGGQAGPDPVIAEVGATGRAGRMRAAGPPAEGVTLAGPLLARYSPVALP